MCKAIFLKSFVSLTRAGVFIWKNFHPGYWDLGRTNRQLGNLASQAFHMNTPKFLRRRVGMRDLGNWTSSVNRAYMKRSYVLCLELFLWFWFRVRLLKPDHRDNESQSDGRTEIIDSNIFKSSQLNSESNFQIQPIKCPVQNNKISTSSLGCSRDYETYATRNCQAQSVTRQSNDSHQVTVDI